MATVLVADDDRDIREMVTLKLQTQGHEVIAVADGQQAWDEIRRQAPDLALLDVSMPKLSGFEVCQRVRANRETAELPVIFLTARAQDADVESGFAAGADDYLAKPFSTRELVRRIKAFLETHPL
jgi:two-component system response regulator MtrA